MVPYGSRLERSGLHQVAPKRPEHTGFGLQETTPQAPTGLGLAASVCRSMYGFASVCTEIPEEGVEPSPPEGDWILSPARLPFRHSGVQGLPARRGPILSEPALPDKLVPPGLMRPLSSGACRRGVAPHGAAGFLGDSRAPRAYGRSPREAERACREPAACSRKTRCVPPTFPWNAGSFTGKLPAPHVLIARPACRLAYA
jgi:hypothetical protein